MWLETLEEAELPLSEKGLNILEDYYLKKIENYKTAISCDVGDIQINESDIKYEIHGSIFSMKTKYFMILPKNSNYSYQRQKKHLIWSEYINTIMCA